MPEENNQDDGNAVEEFGATTLMSCTKNRPSKGEKMEKFLLRLKVQQMNDRGMKRIKSFSKCENIKVLYLYNNAIQTIENMDTCPNLEILHIYNNHITDMRGVYPLQFLTKLFLGGNQISRVEGLEGLPNLEQLHMSNQRLGQGQHFTLDPESFARLGDSLTTLDISGNGIVMVPQELHYLHRLQTLNMSRNNIEYLDEVTQLFGSCPHLSQVDLRKNPVTKAKKYWQLVVGASGNLMMLDGKPVDNQMKSKVHNIMSARSTRARPSPRNSIATQNHGLGGFGQAPMSSRGLEGGMRVTPRGGSARRSRPSGGMPGYAKYGTNIHLEKKKGREKGQQPAGAE